MKFYILLYLVLLTLSCNIEYSYPKADWTLLFYMADDYSTINLTADIDELTEKKVNSSDIRLVILYDGPDNGDSKIEILDSPFNTNSRIIPLESTSINIDKNGELDMADRQTLKTFIEYAKSKAPADKYALYFGSHGTGFSSKYPAGLAVENGDDINSSFLTVNEIARTLTEVDGINLLTFDACNLGNIETIYEFNDYVDYIIASPEEIPGPGNDYIGFIEAAYGLVDLSVESLGKATIQAYYNFYNKNDNSTYLNGHEAKSLQQLYNVKKISEVVKSSSFKTELTSFLNNKSSTYTSFNYGNYTDIYNLLNNTTILDSAITIAEGGIYKWLSIYMPSSSAYNPDYEKTDFAINNSDWYKILKNQ